METCDNNNQIEPNKRKRGRPPRLSAAKRADFCTLIAAGVGPSKAAEIVGCTIGTVKRHARLDAEFAQQLNAAKLEADLIPFAALRNAAQHNWRAASWYLERKDPDTYARRSPHVFAKPQVKELLRQLRRVIMASSGPESVHDVLLEFDLLAYTYGLGPPPAPSRWFPSSGNVR